MEESKFIDFEKAPFLELEDYKAPEGIKSLDWIREGFKGADC